MLLRNYMNRMRFSLIEKKNMAPYGAYVPESSAIGTKAHSATPMRSPGLPLASRSGGAACTQHADVLQGSRMQKKTRGSNTAPTATSNCPLNILNKAVSFSLLLVVSCYKL